MKRCLVVDDDPLVRQVLQRYLIKKGVEVGVASNGQEALERLRAGPVDVLLLDIKMPVMGGLDLLRRLKADGNSASIVMLTGLDELDVSMQAVALGAKDIIKKPIDLDYLDSVERWTRWFNA